MAGIPKQVLETDGDYDQNTMMTRKTGLMLHQSMRSLDTLANDGGL